MDSLNHQKMTDIGTTASVVRHVRGSTYIAMYTASIYPIRTVLVLSALLFLLLP
jgi:hypothetical protein